MTPASGFGSLQAALRSPGEIVARWTEAFQTSPLRISRSRGGDALATIMSSIIEGFELALPDADASGAPLVPGSHAARELEKAVSFAGASLASAGLSGFDVAAAMLGLRDVLVAYVDEPEASRVRAVFEWLTIIALDSHGSATAMSATERMREQLERGTPVVAVVPEVPAVFLVGAPDSAGLDSIFARLMLLVVRVGATSVIIDTTGLDDAAEPALVEAVGRFLGHRKVAGAVEALAVGLDDEQIAVWRDVAATAGAAMRAVPRFDDALAIALARAGQRIVRSGSSHP